VSLPPEEEVLYARAIVGEISLAYVSPVRSNFAPHVHSFGSRVCFIGVYRDRKDIYTTG
jgi:hypothetical protein